MADYKFGIDFGACNLKCVRADNSKVRAIRLTTRDDGSFHAPNAIYYKKNQDGTIENIIGQYALNTGATSTPENLVFGLKRKLEIKDWKQFIPTLNCEVGAQKVTEDIFQKIFQFATKNVPEGNEAHAAVTVPVIFTKHQRNLIKSAAQKAGFIVDAVINESFAAIFGVDAKEDSLNVIFDLGGSTLDVSIIKFSRDEVLELAAAGLKLGGLDIDRLILEKILKQKFPDQMAANWQQYLNADDLQMDFARRIKENLYSDEFTDSITSADIGAPFDFTLSRAEVDALLESEGYREKIFAMLDELFEELSQNDDYCFDKSDVTKIWAMGATMRIPYFKKLLEDYFGEALFDSQDYDFEDNEGIAEGLENKYLIVAGGAAEFLKKRENITAVNAIPYRICYSLGKDLQPGIAKNMPSGWETRDLKLNLNELESCGWKISLYQTFVDESNFDDAAFFGELNLDSTKYEKKESPLLKMKMMRDGRLRLRFSERRMLDDEPDIILVEELFLNLD